MFFIPSCSGKFTIWILLKVINLYVSLPSSTATHNQGPCLCFMKTQGINVCVFEGYFHSTMLMQVLRKGFLRVKKKRERAGLGFPPVACSFFSFSRCFLFSSSSFMMNEARAGTPPESILEPKEKYQVVKQPVTKTPSLQSFGLLDVHVRPSQFLHLLYPLFCSSSPSRSGKASPHSLALAPAWNSTPSKEKLEKRRAFGCSWLVSGLYIEKH